jgi:flagellar biosynthesis/type III secretory pathway protein FliH
MVRPLIALALFAAITAAQAQAPDPHLQEEGSAAVLAHCTFAHGYRHGYEEGYHAGNTDINMGRSPRSKLTELRDLKIGYTSKFGPKKLFEEGFHAGLKAGYADGYMGRNFRAVGNLRSVAASLEAETSPADPNHSYFDQGFVTGYNKGLEQGNSGQSATAQIDFHMVDCAEFHPASQRDLPAQASYCEGYRRGFALGHADGFILRPEGSRMEASK